MHELMQPSTMSVQAGVADSCEARWTGFTPWSWFNQHGRTVFGLSGGNATRSKHVLSRATVTVDSTWQRVVGESLPRCPAAGCWLMAARFVDLHGLDVSTYNSEALCVPSVFCNIARP